MDDKKKTMYTIHESFRRASDQLEKLEKSQARKKSKENEIKTPIKFNLHGGWKYNLNIKTPILTKNKEEESFG